jgi:hypothetical protein
MHEIVALVLQKRKTKRQPKALFLSNAGSPNPPMMIPQTQFRKLAGSEDLQSHVLPVYHDQAKTPAVLSLEGKPTLLATLNCNSPTIRSALLVATPP